jgi:hypothetical protein
MDNSLKRSFPLEVKGDDDDDCGCGSEKNSVREAFDQSSGAASFLSDDSNLLTERQKRLLNEEEEEDDVPEEFKDQQNGEEEEEEEMEEQSRGAVEDVLAQINDDYEPSSKNETQDRGAVEDVLSDINEGNMDYEEEQGEVPGEQDVGPDEYEEDIEETIDNVVNRILGEKEEEDPCWDGYTQVGMKTQDGQEVPNCVPSDEVDDAEGYEENVNPTSGNVGGVDMLDAVLEDQVQELSKLDRLAEQVLKNE